MKWKHYILVALSLLAFSACSESSGDEFDQEEWRVENEGYFELQYQLHSQATAQQFILPNWSMPENIELEDVKHTNCILVDVLQEGIGGNSPLYTDSVLVHYSGRLIPTDDMPKGYEFDRSYLYEYDADVDVPARLSVKNLVEGFSTALQHMHRGDVWRVTVPYQLGYAAQSQTLIPPYSTLIFEIALVDFWQLQQGDRM